MEGGKKQEKSNIPLICCFSRLEIKDKCVAYGTNTRQNNPVFHGPFYNLYVALIWVLHNNQSKTKDEKRAKVGQLCANFPGLTNGPQIDQKELRVGEFVEADGVRRAEIIKEVCGKYPWLNGCNTNKKAFLENKKSAQEKPKSDSVLTHSYCVTPDLVDREGKPRDCQYFARKDKALGFLRDSNRCYHVEYKGTTYSIIYTDCKEKENVVLNHIFPGCGLEKLEIKGKAVVIGKKPLHRLDEEEKKKQRAPDFVMDKPKDLPLTAIVAKPFGNEEKDPAKKRKRKQEHDDFLKGVINFHLDD